MVIRSRLVSVLASALAMSVAQPACQSKPNPTSNQTPSERPANVLAAETSPVASVNGKALPVARFNMLFDAQRARVRGPLGEAVAWRLKNNLVRNLIDEQLIEEAAERRKVSIDDKKIQAAVDARRKAFANEQAFRQFLATYPEGLAGLRRTERLRLIEEALAGAGDERVLDEEQLKIWFDQHRTQYNVPAHFLAQEIFWPLAKDNAEAQKAKAKETLDFARGGKISFSVLARRYSQGPTAQVGGDLGRVSEGTVEPAIYKAMQALKVGEISEVVSTASGLHIVKLLAKNLAVEIPFAEARPSIERSLRLATRSTRVSQLLMALRREARVENLLPKRYPLLAQADAAVSGGHAPGLGAAIATDAKPSTIGVGKTSEHAAVP